MKKTRVGSLGSRSKEKVNDETLPGSGREPGVVSWKSEGIVQGDSQCQMFHNHQVDKG